MTLKNLKPGEIAEIVKVNGETHLKSKIMDMGLTKGTKVKMRCCAPLGDPLLIEVRGYQLSIRQADAKEVDIVNVRKCEGHSKKRRKRRQKTKRDISIK